MLNVNSVAVSAASEIEGKAAVFFSASFSDSGLEKYSISKNISDPARYKNNKEACDADYAQFEESATKFAQELACGQGGEDA